MKLPLDGFGDAVVSVPLGATSPRSVVVAAHGRNDRPEWACGEWRGITEAGPFILCPHGVPADAPPGRGLAFAGVERTRHEIDAGLAALRARFGAYVTDGPMIYAGFSLGAILGVSVVADDPGRFPIAVLGEGGQEQWTPARVASFSGGGGQRVLFVCSIARVLLKWLPRCPLCHRCQQPVGTPATLATSPPPTPATASGGL